MKSQDGATHTFFEENLNITVMKNGMSNINIKGFMVDNVRTN